MSDVYYHPETSGLTTVGEVNLTDQDYSFDLFVVWQYADGRFTWGSDSGCSCPYPFEETSVAELAVGTARDALGDLQAWVASRGTAVDLMEARRLFETLKEHL